MLITLLTSAAMLAQAPATMIRPLRVAPVNQVKPIGPGGGCDTRPSEGIIVQGGLTPDSGEGPRPGGVLAIGPKQDDPLTAEGGQNPSPGGNGVEAIGPKQDDPRAPGSLVARPGDDEDPQARRNMLAIGPKQDDPRAPGSLVSRPGDDEDPQALVPDNCPKPG